MGIVIIGAVVYVVAVVGLGWLIGRLIRELRG